MKMKKKKEIWRKLIIIFLIYFIIFCFYENFIEYFFLFS
jgi:hypothetical protein